MNVMASCVDSFPFGPWTVHTFFFPQGNALWWRWDDFVFHSMPPISDIFFICLFVFSVATVKIIFQDMKIIDYIIVFALLILTPVKGLVQPAHQLGLMRDIFISWALFQCEADLGFLFFDCCFLVECVAENKRNTNFGFVCKNPLANRYCLFCFHVCERLFCKGFMDALSIHLNCKPAVPNVQKKTILVD